MRAFVFFVWLIIMPSIANATQLEHKNIDADFEECMTAWKEGNVIYNRGAPSIIFVHFKGKIFDIRWKKDGYVCKEKLFSPTVEVASKYHTLSKHFIFCSNGVLDCNKKNKSSLLKSFCPKKVPFCEGKPAVYFNQLELKLAEKKYIRIKGLVLKRRQVEPEFRIPELPDFAAARSRKVTCIDTNPAHVSQLQSRKLYTVSGTFSRLERIARVNSPTDIRLRDCEFEQHIKNTVKQKNIKNIVKQKARETRTNKPITKECNSQPRLCDAVELCQQATYTLSDNTNWKAGTYLPFVKEAKRRKLSCGVQN